ncbi:MAG TPA: acyl-CoA dehydrogenase family protein, partial [Terriglobia bacterium]|nr:acyl-CoA dehydrogenase family protein [Terriglobia bacterium]
MYRLDETQTALITKLHQVADTSIAPAAADVDEKSRFPRESVGALAKAGFLGLTLPAEFGGLAGSMRLACAALEEVAQRCASTAMVYLMHLCGCACYLAQPRGNEQLLRRVA